ncbi:MAG: DUF4097 domain-containing protein [Pseudonocardia sp.]|nr:DUF4097 domain-containing protein [Pseudonocardia sp.]
MTARRLLLLTLGLLLVAGCSVQGLSVGSASGSRDGSRNGEQDGDVTTRRTSATHDGPVSRVEVESDSGDVDLRPGADGTATVTRTARWTGPEPDVAESLDGGVLRITVTCPSPAEVCSVDLAVTAPAATAARTQVGAGDIAVAGLTGTHDLSTASGSVEGTGLGVGAVSARTAAGDVGLTFADAPPQVEAESTAGDVTVRVPAGAAYRVDARTTVGEVEVGIPDDPAATARITARSTAGDVTVSRS